MDASLPLANRVIASMALTAEDHVSMVSVVRFCLGLDAALDLPGTAPIGDFLQRLDAEPVGAEEVTEKERVAKTVTEFVMSTSKRHPKEKRP